MSKKLASVAVAATLLAGAGAGAVMGAPMTALAADTTTEATAKETARTPGQWVGDALKGLVDKGTITQEQSDAVAQALKDARPEHGPGGPGGPGGHGHLASAEIAKVLGISEADLHTALQSNKSLADIAKEHNVDVQKVIDALVAAENTRIDQAVTDGRITKEQADARKAKTVERVTQMVNNTRPERGPRGERAMESAPAPANT